MFTKYHPIRFVIPLLAILALSACAQQVNETSAVAPVPEPVTLRLAISDNHCEASEPYAQEFIDQVKKLSNEEINIEPVWDAGSASKAGFEGRVIEQVKSGQADLGLAASRAWDTAAIKSFQALQAPFLIDNDALAEAVATSDIASRMLEDLSKYGITGLTLWPEDLRHPFSTLLDKPILSPADFAGRKIRVTDSEASWRLIEALGGAPMYGGGGYEGAESGLRQALSLSGTPTATGNVTFFPKYQVLFANGAAFDKLSEAQRAILRQAAAAAQMKAIAEHPGEVEAARTWCADAGAVVLASDEQIAAFEKAAQPVFDWIEQDPQNAELIAAIRELKAKTPPSPAVQACEYELAQQIPTPDASAQTWSTGLPPNGVWQVELTSDDLVRMGVSQANAPDWAAVYTQTFQDDVFTTSWKMTEVPNAGTTGSCTGPYAVVEDFVRIAYDNGGDCFGGEVDDIQWRIDDQGLMHFHLVANQNGPFTEVKATYEAKPYKKVENWSTGMPPNGTWQVTLTNDDVVKMGVSKAKAPDWSGVFTHTFQDGVFSTSWQGTEGYAKGQTASCGGTYEVVEDFVRITLDQDCGNEVDDIQWRLDNEGLHVHLVAIQNGPEVEVRAALEAKPYQKIADK